MKNLTLKNFFEKIYPRDVNLGKALWNSGGIIYTTHETEDEYSALVLGEGGMNYTTDIEFDGDEIVETSCTCSNEWAEYCSHVVATLFELRKNVIRKPTNARLTEVGKATKEDEPVKKVADSNKIAQFVTLNDIDQKILKILAVNWVPLNQSKLMEFFNDAGLRADGKKVNATSLRLVLQRLQQMGYLTRDRDNKYRCSLKFADELCDKYFGKDHDFEAIADQTRTGGQKRYFGYWNQRLKSADDYFRDLRIARYEDDVDEFEDNYYALIRHSHSKYTQESLCEYWLPTIFDLEKIEKIPIEIRAFLLNEKLNIQIFALAKPDEYFDYALGHLADFLSEDSESLAAIIAIFYIYQGNWTALQSISKYLSVYKLGTVTAIRQFIAGNNAAALDTFEQALKPYRKEHNNKKVYFHNTDGVFYVLARLKAQNATLGKKADSHITWALKNPTAYDSVFKWLNAVRLYLKNDKRTALQQMNMSFTEYPITSFFKPFCQFWIDKKLVEEKNIKWLYSLTKANGYDWLATELLALQNAIVPDDAERVTLLEQDLAKLGSDPIINVIPNIEDWELAIKALLNLGNNKAASTSTQNRLAWLVDFNTERIQARGQSLNKSGWTKGRVISYDRLRKREIDYLTPQDERMIDSIDYAYGSEIMINKAKIWRQVIGHPLLFLMKSPTVAVQLVEEKPRLIARKEDKGGFRLSFSHNFNHSGYHLVKESPTRYLYMEVTEKMAQIAQAFNGKSLHVPEKGAAALQTAISGLSGAIAVESAFEEENLPTVDADSRACVHLLPIGDGFHVEIYAKPFKTLPPYVKIGMGEPTLITLIDGVKTATNRDLKVEKNELKKLRAAVPILQDVKPKSGVWELEDTEHCLHLLMQLSPLIENKSIILEWPKGEKFSVSKIVGMDQFRMEINEKNNWFELKGTLPIDEEKVLTMQDLLALSNSNEQFVELGKGKFLALTKEFKDRLAEINGLVHTQRDGTIQLHPLAAPAMQNFTDALTNLQAVPSFQENKDRLEKAFSKKFKVPKNFNATLRPYQKEGYQWLQRCAAWGVGACLADDMGLGKTIQALALLTERAKKGPALVIAPASVCRNWMAETKKFAPVLTPILFGEGDRQAMIKKAKKGDLIIVTYDLLTREKATFIEKNFATIILDEAQAIKNRATKRSETAMSLQGDFKIIMTGTPVENHLGELWNLFQFANPGLLGSLDSFAQRFAIPIEKNKDENRRNQLRRLLQPFILRRKKDEVLKDLPEKTEITLTAALSPEERAFYEAIRRNALEKIAMDDSHGGQKHLKILAEIMKLRRAACHPQLADKNAKFVGSAKLDLFAEIIAELRANGHKALVFSQFVGHLKLLEKHLQKEGIAYQYLDGSTPLAKRQQRIDAFQNGEGVIFLISLKAGGTGLNLTAADYVIHMDPWWNPAVEDQATDRAHRIGQERPVTVYRLVAEGTIEEKILQLHEKKRDLADSLLTGTNVSAKLTAKDLLNLISER